MNQRFENFWFLILRKFILKNSSSATFTTSKSIPCNFIMLYFHPPEQEPEPDNSQPQDSSSPGKKSTSVKVALNSNVVVGK